MSDRLASFRGPSTPTRSPIQRQPITPSSPSRSTESTYHRKTRTTLQELRNVTRTWDDLVRIDGLKAVTGLVDARTELDNSLKLLQPEEQPRTHLVGPKLSIMDQRISELDAVVSKLRKQFSRMNSLIDNLEEIFAEAHKSKGWMFVHDEPLWSTWPLEKFVLTMPNLLRPYHRSLISQAALVDKLHNHALTFEESKQIISQWCTQADLQQSDFVSEWEETCAVEVDRWNTR